MNSWMKDERRIAEIINSHSRNKLLGKSVFNENDTTSHTHTQRAQYTDRQTVSHNRKAFKNCFPIKVETRTFAIVRLLYSVVHNVTHDS